MYYQHQYENGLVVLGSQMPWTESITLYLSVPYGHVLDPPEKVGLANIVGEMSLRGAGTRGNRAFLEATESFGLATDQSTARHRTVYIASFMAENLAPAMELLADVIHRPHFPESELESVKQSSRQSIRALEEDPISQMMDHLYTHFMPSPWGRSALGTLESVDSITIEHIREQHQRYFQPEGAVISLAGRFEWDSALELVHRHFGHWKAQSVQWPEKVPSLPNQKHIPYDSSQTHIGLAYPSESRQSPDYLLAWASVGILSGGMSSRLFSELREKRGLCYSVEANHVLLRDWGGISCYCGSSAEHAQKSLELLLFELDRLKLGIEEDELARVKIGAKSSLIMGQECTASRSARLVNDWYYLGRVRSLEEIEQSIDQLSREQINRYLADHPAGPFYLCTIGPEELHV